MKHFTRRLLVCVMMGLIVFGGLSAHVQAKVAESEDSNEVVLSGGGGLFYPFQGQSGISGIIQAMGVLSPQERMGVELEFRKSKTDLFDTKDIDTQSYILRGIGQYYFRPHGISPYVGLGVNIALNVFDGKEIEKQRPSIQVKGDLGIGYGVMGILGVEAPMGQRAALFVESRASADFQVSRYQNQSGKNKLTVENLSGLTGIIGIRVRF